MKLWPIYVPSKGRHETSKLLRRLNDEGIDAAFVVEPLEATAYCQAFPGLDYFVLPEGGQGLTYSRNHILELARLREEEWIWMIDDDISAFLEFNGTKGAKASAREALEAAQAAAQPGVGQIALEYQQFAWSAGGKPKTNSYCDVCVGIKTKVPINYRKVELKEDRDFTLQMIAAGYDTRRVTQYAFAAPSVGSNKGGLHDGYLAGRDTKGAAQLAEMWPWCCEVQTKRSGRIDAKIHWKRVRQKHALTAAQVPAIL